MAGEVFSWLERSGNREGHLHDHVMAGVVHPYLAANETLVNQYYGLLTPYPNLEWVPPDPETLTAARLRAPLSAPHTRTAGQVAHCHKLRKYWFLTNDLSLARITSTEVAFLDQTLGRSATLTLRGFPRVSGVMRKRQFPSR